MDFEELTRKITDIKDKEMAMEFTQTIGKLLKENGVTVHCSECEQSIMTGGLLEIVFDKLDFTEHDKKFIDEIECWKKKCSDLSNYNKQLKYDLGWFEFGKLTGEYKRIYDSMTSTDGWKDGELANYIVSNSFNRKRITPLDILYMYGLV